MTLQELFKKDVARALRCDFKEDIQDFILTSEIKSTILPRLFHSILKPTNLNLSLIIGANGSGRSYLIKYLYCLLDTKNANYGQKISDYFTRCIVGYPELQQIYHDISLTSIDSVYFDADQIDYIKCNKHNPISYLFLCALNRKLGFDEIHPEIAEIERYFDRKGKYGWLQSEFYARHGKDWKDFRPILLLKMQHMKELIAEADDISINEANVKLYKIIHNFDCSVKRVASLINEYLNNQPKDSKFVFLIDNIERYLLESQRNVVNFLNLIQEMDSLTNQRIKIVCTFTKQDYSIDTNLANELMNKIIGKSTCVWLTSSNTLEFVLHDLLDKTPYAFSLLTDIYKAKQREIDELSMSKGNTKMSLKKDFSFELLYPFMDYQILLIENTIQGLIRRKLIGPPQSFLGVHHILQQVLQVVAIKYRNKDVNYIVQFCDMYDGIQDLLPLSLLCQLQDDFDNQHEEMNKKVIKVLFLLKFVKDFNSSAINISKLLISSLDVSICEVEKEVKTSLDYLVKTSCIKKEHNGIYHYLLTSERQKEYDINN